MCSVKLLFRVSTNFDWAKKKRRPTHNENEWTGDDERKRDREREKQKNIEKNLKNSRKTIENQCNNLTSRHCVQSIAAIFFQRHWFDVCAHTKLPANRYWRAEKCQTERPWTMYSHFQHIHKSSYHNVKQNLYLNCMRWSFAFYLFVDSRTRHKQPFFFRSHLFGDAVVVMLDFRNFEYFYVFTANLMEKSTKRTDFLLCQPAKKRREKAKFQTLFSKHRWYDMVKKAPCMPCMWCKHFVRSETDNQPHGKWTMFNWRKFITSMRYVSLTNYILLFTIVFSYDLCHKLNFRTFGITHSVRMFFDWTTKIAAPMHTLYNWNQCARGHILTETLFRRWKTLMHCC